MNAPTKAVRTYRQLWEALINMNDEQLDSNVTVRIPHEDEFYPAELRFAEETDVLDQGHPVIHVLDGH